MAQIITKECYETNCGYRLNDTTKGVFRWLTVLAEEVHAPSKAFLENDTLPEKGECPGFCAAQLKVQYDTTWCFITADAMQSTDCLVLDIDEVPKEVDDIEEWLQAKLPENLEVFWYTTPRHRPEAKRIRVVFRLNREISADEKKSLAKRFKLLQGIDPASFEINKFSLLPCWCQDTVEFKYGHFGSEVFDMDSLGPWIPERPESTSENPFRALRIKNEAKLYEALDKVAEAINDAPCGGSQPIIKREIGKLLAKFTVEQEDLEYLADQIDRDDRRKDTYGIGVYIMNRERISSNQYKGKR